MEVILKKDVDNLGFVDDLVTVKNGYGRNYLIPQGFAILATPSAKKVLEEQGLLWQYKTDFISKTFKKNCRRLDITNARFHDIRRTFGLNLIKNGMPIFQVSKLMGHTTVKTTEQHYAPLLIDDIEDFTI